MTPEQELREEKARKFREMGIPMPIPQDQILETVAATESLVTAKSAHNPSMLSTLEQIKRGYKRNDYQKIIEKVEHVPNKNTSFENIPTNKSQQKQNPNRPERPVLETFAAPKISGGNELLEVEKMFSVDTPSYQQPYRAPAPVYEEQHVQQLQSYPQRRNEIDIDEFGPPPTDYRAKLQKKLNVSLPNRTHENPESPAPSLSNSLLMKKIAESEERMQDMVIDVAEQIAVKLINEMVSDIAKEVAKKTAVETTKKIIVEFAKNGKHLLYETAKVKRAEVISQDKVKIDGKLYKLTEIKS